MTDDWDFDDEFDEFDNLDDEEWLAEWEASETAAADLVVSLVRPHRRPRPTDATLAAAARRLRDGADGEGGWAVAAAGIDDPDDEDDLSLVRDAVAATIVMQEDPEDTLDVEETSAASTLDLADWIAVVVGLVRAGAGGPAHLDAVTALVAAGIDDVVEPVTDPDDLDHVAAGFEVVLRAWRTAGVVTGGRGDERLTALGAWLLPVAAFRAWTGLALPGLDDDRDVPAGWIEAMRDVPAPPLDPDVEAALRAVVGAGPAATDDLLQVAPLEHRDLYAIPWLYEDRQDRWQDLDRLLDGVVLTHRLIAAELAGGWLETSTDLALLNSVWPTDEDGSPLITMWWRGDPPDAHIGGHLGPDGWLPDVAPDTLVAVRFRGREVRVVPLDDPLSDGADLAGALADRYAALGGRNSSGGALDLPELLVETLASTPEVLRSPAPPLGELLAAVGLAVEDHAVIGIDEVGLTADVAAFLNASVVRPYLRAGARALAGDQSDELELARLRRRFEEVDDLAHDLVQAEIGTHGAHVDRLAALAEALRPGARERALGAVEYLLGMVAEARGEARLAQQCHRRAVAADPGLVDAHDRLATLAIDAGEFRVAMRHRQTMGYGPGDSSYDVLASFVDLGRAVGRNDPCPCTSGRKYKKCCEARGGPLPERLRALLAKVDTFLHEPLQRPARVGLALARIDADIPVEELLGAASVDNVFRRHPEALDVVDMLDDPYVAFVAMIEAGGARRYLDARGELLPDDERALVEAWTTTSQQIGRWVTTGEGPGLDVGDGVLVLDPDQAAGMADVGADAWLVRSLHDGARHRPVVAVPLVGDHVATVTALLAEDTSAENWCRWRSTVDV